MTIKSANALRKRYPPAKPVAQTLYCDAIWWGRWWWRKRCTAPCEWVGANGSVTLRGVGVGGVCGICGAPRYCVALHSCALRCRWWYGASMHTGIMPTTATTPTPPPSMTLITRRSVKDATTPMLPYVDSPPIRLVSMLIPAWSVATLWRIR